MGIEGGMNMKKLIKWLSVLLLCLSMAIPAMSSEVQAAAIKLNKTKATMAVKETMTLKVTGTTAKVTWSSSKTAVATVSNGKVTAKKEGTAVITAKAGNKKLTCKVTVKGDYRKLYKAFLEKGKAVYKEGSNTYTDTINSFYVLDIDKNGVPELIALTGDFFNYRHVYTVKSGKMVYCGTDSVRGDKKLYYNSKSKAICIFWWTNGVGGSGVRLLRVSGSKLVPYKYAWSGLSSTGSNGKPIYNYGTSYADAKSVSKSTFDAAINKYVKGYKSYSFISNTAANRNAKFGK